MILVGHDSETYLIDQGNLAPQQVCLSFSCTPPPGARVFSCDRGFVQKAAEGLVTLRALLERPVLLIGTNIAYDMACACRMDPTFLPLVFKAYREGRIVDVGIRQQLIDIAHGRRGGWFRAVDGTNQRISYGLAALVYRHFGIELPKKDTWRLRYAELDPVPLEAWPLEALTYPVDDAYWPVQVFLEQEKHADLLENQYAQSQAAWWLYLNSTWGIETDPASVDAFEGWIRAEVARVKVPLVAAGLVRPNGSRDLKAAASRMRQAPRPQGNLDQDACAQCGDPLLEQYSEYVSLQGKLGRNVKDLRKRLIHTRYTVLRETGRTSSGSDKSSDAARYQANTQNRDRDDVAPGIGDRRCFTARPGYVFIDADYSSFELCTLSEVCMHFFGYSRLGDLIKSGKDPHCDLGSRLIRCSYEEIKANKSHGQWYQARHTSKGANFGFPGGMGAERFQEHARKEYGLMLELDYIRYLKEQWLENFPEMREYFRMINRTLAGGDHARFEQLYVRRYRQCGYCDGCNTFFQGLASDIAKRAGFLIAESCYAIPASPLYGSRIANFIHDEFLVETPEAGDPHAAAVELSRLMVSAGEGLMRHIPIQAEPLLCYHWSKGHEPKHDSNGRLVPSDERFAA